MKATGIIEITEELTLDNPTLEIKDVYLECIFIGDDGLRNCRLIKVDLSTINLVDAQSKNEILNKFK